MGSLPQLFAIQCLTDDLKYITVETTEGSHSGCLMPSTNASVLDSIARFAVEPASDGLGLVHIKSCYNNKYLLCRKSGESWLIAAAASEREENTSYPNCTLFRPELYREGELAEFHHRGTKGIEYNVCHGMPLFLNQYIKASMYKIIDVEATVRMPKRVSFKGDNGKYLCHHIDGGVPYNSFTGDDNSEEVSHYEIFENRRAEIRIKSLRTKKFLRCDNSGWVVADVDSTEPEKDDPDETFKVVKVGDNVIALRNGHGQLFKRVEDKYGISWLRACDESYVVHESRIVVGEPVFKRKIDVQFQFQDATIYGKEVSQTAAISVINGTDEKHELSQGFCYTKTHTATWGSSDQLELGVEATLTAGVPFIVKESIKLRAAYTRTWTRGTTDDYSKQLSSTYTVPVPAKTKVTVNLISEEARYDIPYSYYQTDTYTNGEKFTTYMKDGIYHGVEAYNFYYLPEYEPLSPDSDQNVLPIPPNSDNKIIIPPTLPKSLGDSHPDNKIVLIKSKEQPPVTPPS